MTASESEIRLLANIDAAHKPKPPESPSCRCRSSLADSMRAQLTGGTPKPCSVHPVDGPTNDPLQAAPEPAGDDPMVASILAAVTPSSGLALNASPTAMARAMGLPGANTVIDNTRPLDAA